MPWVKVLEGGRPTTKWVTSKEYKKLEESGKLKEYEEYEKKQKSEQHKKRLIEKIEAHKKEFEKKLGEEKVREILEALHNPETFVEKIGREYKIVAPIKVEKNLENQEKQFSKDWEEYQKYVQDIIKSGDVPIQVSSGVLRKLGIRVKEPVIYTVPGKQLKKHAEFLADVEKKGYHVIELSPGLAHKAGLISSADKESLEKKGETVLTTAEELQQKLESDIKKQEAYQKYLTEQKLKELSFNPAIVGISLFTQPLTYTGTALVEAIAQPIEKGKLEIDTEKFAQAVHGITEQYVREAYLTEPKIFALKKAGQAGLEYGMMVTSVMRPDIFYLMYYPTFAYQAFQFIKEPTLRGGIATALMSIPFLEKVGRIGYLTLKSKLSRTYIPYEKTGIKVTESFTDPITLEKMVSKFADKTATTIHASDSPVWKAFIKEKPEKFLLVGVKEGASPWRLKYDLLHFYKSLPTDEGIPQLYGGYIGIGRGAYEQIKFRLLPSKKFGIIFPEEKITYIKPFKSESFTHYIQRIGFKSGETLIPPENVYKMSIERQVITPSAFEGRFAVYPGSYISFQKYLGWTIYKQYPSWIKSIPILRELFGDWHVIHLVEAKTLPVEPWKISLAKELSKGKGVKVVTEKLSEPHVVKTPLELSYPIFSSIKPFFSYRFSSRPSYYPFQSYYRFFSQPSKIYLSRIPQRPSRISYRISSRLFSRIYKISSRPSYRTSYHTSESVYYPTYRPSYRISQYFSSPNIRTPPISLPSIKSKSTPSITLPSITKYAPDIESLVKGRTKKVKLKELHKLNIKAFTGLEVRPVLRI